MESGLQRTPYVIRVNNILRKDSVDHATTSRTTDVPVKQEDVFLDSQVTSTSRQNSEVGATPETKISELLLSEMPAIVNKQDDILSPFKWDLSNASSEQPSPSPIFSDNIFLPERIDDIPTEFLHGISNINYDFNIFLENAERSISDESIDGKLRAEEAAAVAAAAAAAASIASTSTAVNVDEFDPLKNAVQSPERESSSIIDRPVPPMQSTTLEYMGFSHFEIPSISCSTGADNLIADENSHEPGTSKQADRSTKNTAGGQ